MNLTLSVVSAEVVVPARVGVLPYSGVPPIRLTISQAINRFTDWLEKGGRKANNYPRVAAQFLQLCLTHQWVVDEVAMTLYRAGRAASQGTAVKTFLNWFQVAGSPQIVADPVYHLPPIYHELIDQFLHDHTTLHSLDSKGTYIRVLNAFFAFLFTLEGTGSPAHFSDRSVRRYLDELMARQRSAFTRRLYLSIIQQVAAWAADAQDRLGLSPLQVNNLRSIARLQGPRIDTGRVYKRSLTGTQRDQLLASTESMEDRALVTLLAWGGLRTVEVIRLRGGDIDLTRRTVDVLGKGQQTRTPVVLSAECVAALSAFQPIEGYSGTNPLFSRIGTTRTIRRRIRHLFELAGVAESSVSAHSLRHTAAQRLLDDGLEPRHVQRHLRHKNFQTTQVYIRYGSDESYVQAMTKLPAVDLPVCP